MSDKPTTSGQANADNDSTFLLDACLDLEKLHFDEGFQEGFEEGKILGRDEGRILGLQQGFQLGFEVGYYAGCLEVIKCRMKSISTGRGMSTGSSLYAKMQKQMQALDRALHGFPFQDPHDSRLQEKTDDIRAKWKVLATILNIVDGYQQDQGPVAIRVSSLNTEKMSEKFAQLDF